MDFKKYFSELKKRNVLKAGLAYLVVAWLLIQVASIILPTFNTPPFVFKSILFILIIVFPIWLIFAWAYDITPEGIKKAKDAQLDNVSRLKTRDRLNKVIIAALSLVVILLLINQFSNTSENKINLVNELDKSEKSIAVMAFADMSPQKDQEYLSDGMSAEFINILGRAKGLKVRDRRSSFSYKGKDATIEQIGTALKVDFVIDGSVRKFGDQVRVDVQIIDANDGTNIWTESFDYTLENIFKMQDDIAKSISKQLKLSLGIEDVTNQRGTNNVEAYQYLLKGEHIHYNEIFDQNKTSEVNQKLFYEAEALFLKAIELDSTYADAHALLADLYDSASWIFPNDSSFTLKAQHEMDLAFQLNPNSSLVNYVKGVFYERYDDHDNAFGSFAQSFKIDPYKGMRSAHKLLSRLMYYGLYEDAIKLTFKVLEYDPLDLESIWRLGFANQLLGNYDIAEKYYLEALKFGRDNMHYVLSRFYCLERNIPKAELHFNEFLKNDNYTSERENTLKAYMLAAKKDKKALEFLRSSDILLMLGNYDEWFYYMDAFFEKNPMRSYYYPLSIDPKVSKNVHQEYLNIFLPLRKNPRYSKMYNEQKRRFDDNITRFGLKNSVLKDL